MNIPPKNGIELVNIKIGDRYKIIVTRGVATRFVSNDISEISLKYSQTGTQMKIFAKNSER